MIIANQRCYAKNLPKQTQQYSVHLDQQVEHRQEVAVSTAVADERRRSKCSTREWPSNSPHFFFVFLTKPSRVVVFNTDIEQQGRLTSTECTIISLYLLLPSFFFFFWWIAPSPPKGAPKGGEDSKRSSEHEQLSTSTNPLASTVPLAPQKTNRRKSWWAWTQIETGETV